MARKDLLKGLMEAAKAPAPTPASGSGDEKDKARVDAARPRYSRGAIGAVSQSIADLKSRSIQEIDPHLIQYAGPIDRLVDVEEEEDTLEESIRQYGQQVPVLLRPHPEEEGQYQVVYGRRRVAAMRRLGQPVKAMIRDLDETEFVLAQGQENSARRDLSYIEKCNFARQLRDDGYDRKIICDALHVDKTQISRMLSIADRVPVGLIQLIGPAPSVGRDRWNALAEIMALRQGDWVPAMHEIYNQGSDQAFVTAFEALKAAMATPKAKVVAREAVQITTQEGKTLAHFKRTAGAYTLEFKKREHADFADWLSAELPNLYHRWRDTAPAEGKSSSISNQQKEAQKAKPKE